METQKANTLTEKQISEQDKKLEKLAKKQKERQLVNDQLRLDDLLMRQDLSTYECKVNEKLDLESKFSKL